MFDVLNDYEKTIESISFTLNGKRYAGEIIYKELTIVCLDTGEFFRHWSKIPNLDSSDFMIGFVKYL